MNIFKKAVSAMKTDINKQLVQDTKHNYIKIQFDLIDTKCDYDKKINEVEAERRKYELAKKVMQEPKG